MLLISQQNTIIYPLCDVKNITDIIINYLSDNDISQTTLAKRLDITQQSIWRKLQSKELDTGFIFNVSEALNHNFFEDLSREYEEHAKRKSFDLSEVVNEPVPGYGPIEKTIEQVLRKHKLIE